MRQLFLVAVLAVLVSLSPCRGDWPQWRGPNRSGVSTETGLLKEWPDEGPKLLWKATGLGTGFSPVSAANGRLYTLGYSTEGEFALALDPASGKELWKVLVGPGIKDGVGMRWLSQRSPTVDGERLYAVSAYGDLVCLDSANGKGDC